MKTKLAVAGLALVAMAGLATAGKVLPEGSPTVECTVAGCSVSGKYAVTGNGFSGRSVHLDVYQGSRLVGNTNATVDNRGYFETGLLAMDGFTPGVDAEVFIYSKAGKDLQLTGYTKFATE